MNLTALIVFILILAVDVVGLMIDTWLVMAGKPTISQLAFNNIWISVTIMLWQQLAAIALYVHFYT